MNTLRIISLNLQHGGGRRISAIADWILAHAPEVVVLPEWRSNDQGRYLTERLAQRGIGVAHVVRASNKNAVLIAAPSLIRGQDITPTGSEAGSLLSVETSGIRIVGCYFPQQKAKAPFFHQCLQAAKDHAASPFLIIGDLNTGRNDIDREGGAKFACVDLFAALQTEAGLVDLFRAEARRPPRMDVALRKKWVSCRSCLRKPSAAGSLPNVPMPY